MSVKKKLFQSLSIKCFLNDLEYTVFKMFVTQMSNYIFIISFQLMFNKTLRYRLARALNLKHCIILVTVLFFYFLLCFHVEGVQPEDDELERKGDAPSEQDEEISDNDTAAINLDDDQQPEDDDESNSEKMFLYSEGNRDNVS